MSENGESPPPATTEEQSQPSEAAESAPSGEGRQRTSDSWVMVEDPESKPSETSGDQDQPPKEGEPEKPAEPESQPEAEPELEPEPEKPAEPESEPEKPAEPEPEPEKPTEPEPEPEKPAEEEPKPEPEPEKPAEPEPEPEKPSEPEPEPEKPAEAEPQAEPEPEKPAEPEPQAEAEPEKPAEPEAEKQPEEDKKEERPAAEPEQPKEEPAKEDDKPAEQEKPADAVEGGEKKDDSVTVEVTVDVNGTTAAPEEPKEELPEPGAEIHYGQYLRQLKLGSDLLKVKKSKNFPRVYRLEEDLQWISWNSHNKKAIRARISVNGITEVRSGRNTDSFKISSSTHQPELCFSIIYIDGRETKVLDLVAMTEEDRKAWVEGLKALVREEEDKFSSKVRERWLRDLFDEADKNGDGTLDLKEVVQMMKSLNVSVSKKVVKKMFKDADSNGDYDGKLSFEEFCALFKELASRPELRRLFYLYSSKMEWWTVQDLQRFLQTEQGADNPSIELCTQIVQRYETTPQGKEENMMSLDGFTQFMLGPESDIFNVDHNNVYQDMSQPLSAYFIASSHNTYLLEDQLKGPSSCEAYINALKRGCRCVELDCWDGPDGEPIIYHGYTLTSKILFKDVIEVIKEYAFQASPFPVILSIENHCSIPQQHRMADIMDEIFGELLFKAKRDEDSVLLPSPNQLKHKILIKGKKLPQSVEEAEDDEGEVSDEDEAMDLDQEELSKIKPKPEEVATPTAAAAAETSAEEPKAEEKTEPAADKGEEGEKPKEPEAAAAAEQPKEEEKPKEEEGKPKAEGESKPEEGEKPKESEEAQGGAEEQPKKEEEQPKEGEQAAASAGDKEGEKKEEGDKKDEGEKKEGEGEKKEGAEASGATLAPPGSPSKADRVKRVLSFRSRQKKSPAAAPADARPAKKIKLSSKLSALVNYIQSVHFKGFEELDNGKCFHMSSFGESSAMKYSSSLASKYVQYNRRQISRTYPAGSRVTSTNYDPVPMWNAGCQIVALNYQTEGRPLDFNDGRFRANGGTGYILKPDYMRQELARFDHTQRNAHIGGLTPKVLTIKVISGQQLPKPGGGKKGEVIDPYVKIQIEGVGEDSQVVKTKTVDDNGFNPVWNEVFQFIIRNPDLALIRFKVMDKDVNGDDFIGSFCLPFTSVVPGYRHIHLTFAGSRDDRIGNATIFVHVQVQDYVAHKVGHKSRTTLKVKKSRDYPEHALVGHQPIDLLFRNVAGPLHKVVDLKEDFSFALLHFKELCGCGGQADVGECVELLAERVAAIKLKLQIVSIKKDESHEVYKAVVVATEEGKTATVPHLLQQVVDAFNQLNLIIKDILEHADPLSHELENIYKEAEQMKEGLQTHLRETGTAQRRADQVMDHYCRTMHSLNAESEQARELKKEAEKQLKKIVAGIQSAGIELKSAV